MKTGVKPLWAVALVAGLSLWALGHLPVPGTSARRFREDLGQWPAPPPIARRAAAVALAQPPSCASRYTRFPRPKAEDVKRIGVFGGSPVVGAEAASGFDFPTLLEAHLRKRGRAVQVLNFGHAWQSLQQSYLLAKAMIPRYELDYVILSVPHLNNELSFLPDPRLYGPIRPRLIVRDGKLERIAPSHDRPAEAAEAYHRWLPPWRYLRYDRQIPAFFSHLPETLRPSRNPFYYRSDGIEEERRELFRALLKDLADSGAVVLVQSGVNELTRAARGVSDRVYAWTSQVDPTVLPFLYLAPRGHLSSLGNDLRARELADLLTGRAAPDLAWWEPRLRSQALSTLASTSPKSIAGATLAIGGWPIGGFNHRRPGQAEWELTPTAGQVPAALLAMAGGPGWMFSLPEKLKPTDRVELRVWTQSGQRRIPLGTMTPVSDTVAEWKPPGDLPDAVRWDWKEQALWIRCRHWKRAELWAGATRLLSGALETAGLRLSPDPRRVWFLRLGPNLLSGTEPPSLDLDLTWRENGGQERQVTLYRLERSAARDTSPFPPFPHTL